MGVIDNPKIVFFEVPPEEESALSDLLKPLRVEFHEEKLNKETLHLAEEANIVSVFINSELRADILVELPDLKHIATRSTGFDHIDLAIAKERGVSVSNVPSYGSRSVAEFTFALMLNVSRKIFQARHQLLEGDSFDISKLEGFDLYGKTLGVIGTGKIGKNVVKIAKAFGMNVLAHDLFEDKKFESEIGFKYVSLTEALSQSDVVTLHTLFNDSTRHIINKDNIGLFKPGAYLINTARGELVETDALVQALASGTLAGAGLDVLESERPLKEEMTLLAKGGEGLKDWKTLYENQVILDMPQVVITPHIAFCSREAKHEIERVTVENIKAFLSGKPQNQI
ncbi:MAG: NAD(P)-dependent oxidoreductase [bacterium]